VSRPTVFEFAGAGPAFVRLATAHHQRCLEDPVLNHPFSHPGEPDHIERLAAYWAEVFGGPPRYTEAYGGHSGMLAVHAGIGEVDDDLGERFVSCFVRAADDGGLPVDPAFRATLRAYMEWAVAEALTYAPEGSQVPEDLSMPHWGWDGQLPTTEWAPNPANGRDSTP